jgi:hypothetical protein
MGHEEEVLAKALVWMPRICEPTILRMSTAGDHSPVLDDPLAPLLAILGMFSRASQLLGHVWCFGLSFTLLPDLTWPLGLHRHTEAYPIASANMTDSRGAVGLGVPTIAWLVHT